MRHSGTSLLSGGLRPPDPLTPSLAGAPCPAPLRRLARALARIGAGFLDRLRRRSRGSPFRIVRWAWSVGLAALFAVPSIRAVSAGMAGQAGQGAGRFLN